MRELFPFDEPERPGEHTRGQWLEAFAVLATIDLAWSWAAYTSRVGDVVLPLGLARWLDLSLFHRPGVALALAFAITLLVLGGALRLWRYAYALSFAGMLVLYSARFCLGEIPHSANLTGMTLLGFALGHAAFDRELDRRRFALGFACFAVGLAYTSAAVSKLLATGPLWVDGRHLWLWIAEKQTDATSKLGLSELNWLQRVLMSSRALATAVLAFGLLAEAAAFSFWWRRWRTWSGLALLGLHIGIYLSMSILFHLNIIELVILILPFGLASGRREGEPA